MILYLLSDIEHPNIQTFLSLYKKINVSNSIIQIHNKTEVSTTPPTINISDIGYILCKEKSQCRILICTQNIIQQKDYMKVLNCSHTCTRYNIRIDVCSTVSNPILRQASLITKGVYTTTSLRGLISLLGNKVMSSTISFNIKCLCHDTNVLLGLTCPVCLGVYCKFVPVCRRCKTKFVFQKK